MVCSSVQPIGLRITGPGQTINSINMLFSFIRIPNLCHVSCVFRSVYFFSCFFVYFFPIFSRKIPFSNLAKDSVCRYDSVKKKKKKKTPPVLERVFESETKNTFLHEKMIHKALLGSVVPCNKLCCDQQAATVNQQNKLNCIQRREVCREMRMPTISEI